MGAPGLKMMSEIHQGEVYWLDFGHPSDSRPAQRHPCVVVQCDIFNRSRIGTTVVCLITSNMARAAAPGNVTLRIGDANLPKPSVVNVSQIVTVDKAELTEPEGKLSRATMTEIRNGLNLLFG